MNLGIRSNPWSRLFGRISFLAAGTISLLVSASAPRPASAAIVAPYFFTWGYNSSAYKVRNLMDARQKEQLSAVTLAFALGTSGCKLTSDVDNMLPDIKNFIAAGGKVLISFGGAAGTYLETTCSTAAALAATIDGLIQRTGSYNLDFDIEGGSTGNATANNLRTQALKILQTKYPQLYVAYTLAVDAAHGGSPGGLASDGLNILKMSIAAGVRIDMVNIMTMDYYYTVAGKTMGDLAISATEATLAQLKTLYPQKTTAQLYGMIGITPMIGENDDHSMFTVADAKKVAAYAKTNGIGLLAFWALQRDQVGAGSLDNYSNANSVDFEFYYAFKTAEGGTTPTPTPTPSPTPTPKPTVTPSPTPKPTPTVTPSPTPKPTPTTSPTPKPTPTVSPSPTPTPTSSPDPTLPKCLTWRPRGTYKKGDIVLYEANNYTARRKLSHAGKKRTPDKTPRDWRKGGQCSL